MESWNWIFGGSTGETGENKSTFVFLRGRSVKLFDANQLFFALKDIFVRIVEKGEEGNLFNS